eukprot:TRINITY_DN27073_c0_g1_i1.p1 TRINITY_DN27073_c0_g1~~TRINITY_DN27073_c0_g1_i1.p1  ORF type:complete len:413 (+),score=73.18 TRINITY_DN27073_c0_g1_i1:257-1495(+)
MGQFCSIREEFEGCDRCIDTWESIRPLAERGAATERQSSGAVKSMGEGIGGVREENTTWAVVQDTDANRTEAASGESSSKSTANSADNTFPTTLSRIKETMCESVNSDTASRHAKYLDRKRQRKAAGGGVSRQEFLSNVPEIDADIEYRYSFHVVADDCQQAVAACCESEAAKFFSGIKDTRADVASSKDASEPSVPNVNLGSNRCITVVPHPPKPGVKAKHAKLAFHTQTFAQDMPKLRTRFEALGTTVVFLLVVDAESVGGETFEKQLWKYQTAVFGMQERPRKLRPSRAMILAYAGVPREEAEWNNHIERLELVDGPVWRFGPVACSDGNALYEIFAKIASARLLRTQSTDGAESDGSHASDAPPVWEAERGGTVHEDDGEDEGDSENEADNMKRFRHKWLSPMEAGAA